MELPMALSKILIHCQMFDLKECQKPVMKDIKDMSRLIVIRCSAILFAEYIRATNKLAQSNALLDGENTTKY